MGRKSDPRRNAYGAWLHYLRKEKKLTQGKLAKQAGIPQTTWAYWERTGKLPGRETIVRLAAILGVSVAKLLRADKLESNLSSEAQMKRGADVEASGGQE